MRRLDYSYLITRVFVCLALVFVSSFSIAATQFNSRKEIEAEVTRLWSFKAFGELDKLEKSLRAENAMTASGWPSLAMFYQALNGLPSLVEGTPDELSSTYSAVEKWSAKYPSSQFGHLFKANVLMASAFQARGTGYSNTVSKAQWVAYNAYMNQARQYLDQHKKELAENPNWYEKMLDIANYQSWPRPSYEALLSEALSRHGTYLPFLMSSVFAYTPKWGGSYGKMIEIINANVGRVPVSLRDEIYARQYSYAIEQSLFPDRSIANVNCDRWLKGNDEITRKYATTHNFNHAAFAAIVCANKPVAKRYFALVGNNPPDLSFWGTFEKFTELRKSTLEEQ